MLIFMIRIIIINHNQCCRIILFLWTKWEWKISLLLSFETTEIWLFTKNDYFIEAYLWASQGLIGKRNVHVEESWSSSFFGDEVVEFFLWDNSITVGISPLDHFLENIVVSQFSQILGDLSEVLEGNESWIESTLPVFWLSKVMNTLWTSSLDSLSLGLVVIM